MVVTLHIASRPPQEQGCQVTSLMEEVSALRSQLATLSEVSHDTTGQQVSLCPPLPPSLCPHPLTAPLTQPPHLLTAPLTVFLSLSSPVPLQEMAISNYNHEQTLSSLGGELVEVRAALRVNPSHYPLLHCHTATPPLSGNRTLRPPGLDWRLNWSVWLDSCMRWRTLFRYSRPSHPHLYITSLPPSLLPSKRRRRLRRPSSWWAVSRNTSRRTIRKNSCKRWRESQKKERPCWRSATVCVLAREHMQ